MTKTATRKNKKTPRNGFWGIRTTGKKFRYLLIWPTQKIIKPINDELQVVTVIGGYAGYWLLKDAEEHRKSLEEFWPGLKSRLIFLEEEAPVNIAQDPGWRDQADAEGMVEPKEEEQSDPPLVEEKAH